MNVFLKQDTRPSLTDTQENYTKKVSFDSKRQMICFFLIPHTMKVY